MLNLILLIAMTLAALWAVMARSLLKATIGLAVASAVISILMFRLNAPLAAVFELSVCTGLITAVFASAISLTKPMTHKEILELSRNKIRRYWYLPVIMVIAAISIIASKWTLVIGNTPKFSETDARTIMWNLRQIDLFGQIVLLLAGALAVVILFMETKDTED
jgi:NADH-quinone oxidoreductase subunit J